MKCPVCNVDLSITERQGVEIDYCRKCRGVWLDRGELDKLIERSNVVEKLPPTRSEREPFYPDEDDYEYKRKNDQYYREDDRHYPHGKKKKSFLSDIFDIFD